MISGTHLPQSFEDGFHWQMCDCCRGRLLAPQPGAIIEMIINHDLGWYHPIVGKKLLLVGAALDPNSQHVLYVSENDECFKNMDEEDLMYFINRPNFINIFGAAFPSLKDIHRLTLGIKQVPAEICRIIGFDEFLYEKAAEAYKQ